MPSANLNRNLGILCHITSLPNPHLGRDGAIRFLDVLDDIGASVWQMLPIHPPDSHGSPYASSSAFAGWSGLIDADLEDSVSQDEVDEFLNEQQSWIHDYATFRVLKQRFNEAAWTDWPDECRNRSVINLDSNETIRFNEIIEEQVRFHRNWLRLREAAMEKDIQLYGDVPFFVSHDSADVWAAPHRFCLDAFGKPTHVSGVPPDYFSKTGQRWGTPLYHWEAHREEAFAWWKNRMKRMFELFDLVRIDHFRAFEAAWSIPVQHPTAEHGQWKEGPGDELLQKIVEVCPSGIIAEDLGIIPKSIHDMRKRHSIPGMAVLQFSNEDPSNPHHPDNHRKDTVVYTGTHDNNTTVGWGNIPVEDMIISAMTSPARLCVIPIQDVLQLGSEARMNTPGTTEGNWCWTFEWKDLESMPVEWFRENATRLRPRT